jgi:hypothetical protein
LLPLLVLQVLRVVAQIDIGGAGSEIPGARLVAQDVFVRGIERALITWAVLE